MLSENRDAPLPPPFFFFFFFFFFYSVSELFLSKGMMTLSNIQHQQKNQRKYLRSMYIWITLAMLLILGLFATATYFRAGQAILNNEYQSNQKILSQVTFNIDFMDDMIRNSVLSLYFNPDVKSII